MLGAPLCNFYTLLQIPSDASPSDIKLAYHRTLLHLHPDKQARLRTQTGTSAVADTTLAPTPAPALPTRRCPAAEETSVDMALLKEAYRTLSDVGLRAAYDGSLRRQAHARSHGPRPAQIVSLDEFTVIETEMGALQEWRYTCRCGGTYRINEEDLEDETHLICCESCSEAIWVGYEETTTEGEEGEGEGEGK